MQKLSNVLKWVLVSSADPSKFSATLKFALLGIIPGAMSVMGLACGFQLVCVNVTASDLTTVVNEFSQLVFLILSVVSIVGAIWGFARKLVRTANGTNAAFSNL